MDLDYIKSQWARLKAHEAELQKQLEKNHAVQTSFFKKAVDEGFYQQDGEWLKNESCSTCRFYIEGVCRNVNSELYLRSVNPLGSCSNGWDTKGSSTVWDFYPEVE